ncbi:phosphatidylserine synthase 2 isoform X2 [Myotis yumanensis]|uniref:phosphatidylserine synthase 2 isoform X2 n=1 Tax=Myotis yumanensis TaxID=159337 RepID=UPI0038D3625F
MRRGERRGAGGPRPGSPVPAGKAALEEPPDGPPAGRRSTESEVYDDGTNTFFWRAHTLTVLFILTCVLGYVTLLEETPQDTAYNTKSVLEVLAVCQRGLRAVPHLHTLPDRAGWPPVSEVRGPQAGGSAAGEGLWWELPHLRRRQRDRPLPQRLGQAGWLRARALYRLVPEDPDDPRLVDMHHRERDVRVPGIQPGAPAAQLQRVLVGPLDHGRADLQWAGHLLRHEDPQVAVPEDVQVAGPLEHSDLQGQDEEDRFPVHALQLGPLRVEARLQPAPLAGRVRHHPGGKAGCLPRTARWARGHRPHSPVPQFLLAELNTFYLKFVLWLPPEHSLVLLRLVFFVNVGGVAMREIYDFMDDPKPHKKLGQQAWLVAAITATELLIVVKYDPQTLTLSLPFYIAQCWTLGSVLVLTWTVWRFFLRDITLRYKETRRQKQQRSSGQGNTVGHADRHPSGPDSPSGPLEAEREGAPALN